MNPKTNRHRRVVKRGQDEFGELRSFIAVPSIPETLPKDNGEGPSSSTYYHSLPTSQSYENFQSDESSYFTNTIPPFPQNNGKRSSSSSQGPALTSQSHEDRQSDETRNLKAQKRTKISIKKKMELINYRKNHPDETTTSIAELFDIARTTVIGILKKELTLVSLNGSQSTDGYHRVTCSPKRPAEAALVYWINDLHVRGISVSNQKIRAQIFDINRMVSTLIGVPEEPKEHDEPEEYDEPEEHDELEEPGEIKEPEELEGSEELGGTDESKKSKETKKPLSSPRFTPSWLKGFKRRNPDVLRMMESTSPISTYEMEWRDKMNIFHHYEQDAIHFCYSTSMFLDAPSTDDTAGKNNIEHPEAHIILCSNITGTKRRDPFIVYNSEIIISEQIKQWFSDFEACACGETLLIVNPKLYDVISLVASENGQGRVFPIPIFDNVNSPLVHLSATLIKEFKIWYYFLRFQNRSQTLQRNDYSSLIERAWHRIPGSFINNCLNHLRRVAGLPKSRMVLESTEEEESATSQFGGMFSQVISPHAEMYCLNQDGDTGPSSLILNQIIMNLEE
ncbi:hypothetical protein BGZ46_002424 [Entomortierella lignicola]|nr:hypothetical protein BGZ46_002424 [Entomortierella lignicola]